MMQVAAKDISFGFVPDIGLLDGFIVRDADREIAPLHRAPWVGTADVMPADAAPHMTWLGGDFFCAPFAKNEDGSALHGWPANSPWRVVTLDPGVLVAVLMHPVFGATLTKTLSVREGHPFVYQTHSFRGGKGRVTVSNHANVSLKSGGLIRTSRKRVWETPSTQQESDPARGRSALVYPAQSHDPSKFPGVVGPVDLTRYPWNPRHEDFVTGVEAIGHDLGWTAVTRPADGDLYLSLRNPRVLPMTMLWHSNGGRDYPPWSSRHFGCLGVEEGAAEHMLSISTEADLSGPGALTLNPAGTADVRHVIGAIAWPSGEAVVDIRIDGDALRITGEGRAMRLVPFEKGFLHSAKAEK